jgi:chromosome segregation ATPase
MNTILIVFLLLSPLMIPITPQSAPTLTRPGDPQSQKSESKTADDKDLKAILQELVVEVRLLRQQFERLTRSQQAQLLLQQVEFQESKLERLERQLQENRDSIANAEQQLQQSQVNLQQINKQLEQASEPAERSSLESVRESVKTVITHSRREIQRLQQREADLTQKVTETQATLEELYQRLDALEKESRKPPER